jgi:hypothetical protein
LWRATHEANVPGRMWCNLTNAHCQRVEARQSATRRRCSAGPCSWDPPDGEEDTGRGAAGEVAQ